MAHYTLRELKEELNKLPDVELNEPLYVQQEDGAIRVGGHGIVEDDIYYHKDDHDDRGSIKNLQDMHGDEFVLTDYLPGPKKGRFFLMEDF